MHTGKFKCIGAFTKLLSSDISFNKIKNFQIEISLLCNAPLFKINHELYQSDFQFFYYLYQSIYFSFSIQGR